MSVGNIEDLEGVDYSLVFIELAKQKREAAILYKTKESQACYRGVRSHICNVTVSGNQAMLSRGQA